MRKIYSVRLLIEKFNEAWSDDTEWDILTDNENDETADTACNALLSACRYPLWILDKGLSKTEKATFKEMLQGLATVDPKTGRNAKSADVEVYSEIPLADNNGLYGFMWPSRHVKGTRNRLRASAIVRYLRDEPTPEEREAERLARLEETMAEIALCEAEDAKMAARWGRN